ncbi:MAG: prepilin-type N-terminal cleavage/methylation domain-containing protein [Verrucomicrobiota bacterium]
MKLFLTNRGKQAHGGLTLVELLTVMAVIGVLGAVSFQMMNPQSAGAVVRESTGTVLSLLEQARAKAILQRQGVAVVFGNPGTIGAGANPENRMQIQILELGEEFPSSGPLPYTKVVEMEQLPAGVIISEGSAEDGTQAPNFLTFPKRTFAEVDPETGIAGEATSAFSAITFSRLGTVSFPSGAGDIEISVGSGRYVGTEVFEDESNQEYLLLGRSTGRAYWVRP